MLATQGMFGPIQVQDKNGSRGLLINGQLQGGSFLNPGAEVASPELDGPGPVSASPYTLGWHAAALHHPTGRALMIGLGSGAGITTLLYEFPSLEIDVVEIDPKLVELCLQGFPLIRHYRDQGRLRILLGDAGEWIADNNQHYDFVCHDAYDGGKDMTLGGEDFYARLGELADAVWVNIIGKPYEGFMLEQMHAMAMAGVPPRSILCADHSLLSPFGQFTNMRRNWIVSSEETIPELMDAYEPYEGLEEVVEGDAIEKVRGLWDLVVGSEMDADEIQELVACLDG